MKKKYTHLGIGNRLKELRNILTQKDFAKKIGIPLVTYQKYESGERMPPGPILERVAELYGKTVDWLLGRSIESVIATARAEHEAEIAELTALSKLAFEKLTSSLGAAYTPEERELMVMLVMILRGKNEDNRRAIIENVKAFYKTRNVTTEDDYKKTPEYPEESGGHGMVGDHPRLDQGPKLGGNSYLEDVG